jgi:hypothetical protein
MSYVRAGFPYDTAGTADASGRCLSARTGQYANPNPGRDNEPYWRNLQTWLAAAYALRLKPVVALTPGTATIDAASSNPGADPAGTRRYACGVRRLLHLAASWGTPIRQLEAWNEPNLTGYSGDPAGAAHVYDVAYGQVAEFAAAEPGQGPVELAAGSMSSMTSVLCDGGAPCPDTTRWLSTYIEHLKHRPGFWSFHDYADITAAGVESTDAYSANLDAFISVLASHYGAGDRTPIWLTEAATQLHGGLVREPNGTARTCDNGEPGDELSPRGEWRMSACLDQDTVAARQRQAWAARAWLQIPIRNPRVTQIDWWTPNTGAYVGWDSALLDSIDTPRASYCVLAYGEDPATAAADARCQGNPLDVGDSPEIDSLLSDALPG